MHFWTYRLITKLLDKCLICPLSEDPPTSNMVNGLKHCWNVNGSTFAIFIDYCEGNWAGKSLSLWYAKYSDYFLTHWLPMTSILFLIETIYCNIFRCNYLGNIKTFSQYFFAFWKSKFNFEVFPKKMTLIADVFLNLQTSKNMVTYMSKKSRFRGPFKD